jgi:hypothetical protein
LANLGSSISTGLRGMCRLVCAARSAMRTSQFSQRSPPFRFLSCQGGTLPHGPKGLGVGIVSNATGLDFAGGPIPARYSIQGNLSQPSGFSSNYSITQQGFTADVTCRQQDVEDPHRPSLKGSYSEMLYPDFDPVLHFNYTLQKWMWQTWCPDGNFSCKLRQKIGDWGWRTHKYPPHCRSRRGRLSDHDDDIRTGHPQRWSRAR